MGKDSEFIKEMRNDPRWSDKNFRASCANIDLGHVPRYLYKYCRINENTLANLSNNQLWFSNPQKFNDPFDCQFSIKSGFTKKDHENFIDHYIKYGILDRAKREFYIRNMISQPDQIKKIVNRNIEKVIIKLGICCFSERNDDILMWSHYSDNHTGMCMKFDVLDDIAFFFAGDSSKPTKAVGRLIYQQDYSQLNAKQILKEKQIVRVIPFTKFLDWKHEKEIRIIAPQSGPIKVNKNALKEIIFGLKIRPRDKNRIIKSIKYNDVKFYDAVKSDTEFKLKFEKSKITT
jgi:hypothetical protein